MPSSTGLKSAVKVVLRLCAIMALVTFLVVEGGLRLFGVGYPNFYRDDARRGWAHQPGISGWYRSEGEAYVTISSQGLRDREHTVVKPGDTVRIAILGDSFAEALQVPAETTFWAVIEKELANCPRYSGKKVEVINFGVSSYGTTNEYLTLQDEVWKFSPDIVLLAFFTGNDFMDNVPALDHVTRRPYYRVSGGKLELDLSKNEPLPIYRRAWQFGQHHLRFIQVAQKIRHTRTAAAAAAGGDEIGLSDHVYKAPVTPEWKEAWDITRAVLVAIRDDVHRHKATMLLATLSNALQVNPDEMLRASYMKKIGVDTLFYPDQELARFATENDIPVLTTAPTLLAYATEKKMCLHGFATGRTCQGHWNAEGHAVAGRLMARALCGN